MDKNIKIFVAGHTGLVGSSIVRNLKLKGYNYFVYRTEKELDLTEQGPVEEFFKTEKPDWVFLAAAKVGGIHANNIYPADFIRINLKIQTNVIDASYKYGVKKLMFLGSGCIYPRMAPQPIKEEYLLTSALELTNEAYAVAKIAGLKMCQYYNQQYGTNFISVMPANLYGPNDNFDYENSHVLPALMRKIHEAKVNGDEFATIWGTGQAMREFMYIDDVGDSIVYLMENYNENQFLNIGTGQEVKICELADIIKEVVGFKGEFKYDSSKPDGTPRKLLDITRLSKTGWKHKVGLKEGIEKTYKWFLDNYDNLRK